MFYVVYTMNAFRLFYSVTFTSAYIFICFRCFRIKSDHAYDKYFAQNVYLFVSREDKLC